MGFRPHHRRPRNSDPRGRKGNPSRHDPKCGSGSPLAESVAAAQHPWRLMKPAVPGSRRSERRALMFLQWLERVRRNLDLSAFENTFPGARDLALENDHRGKRIAHGQKPVDVSFPAERAPIPIRDGVFVVDRQKQSCRRFG